VPTRPAPSSWGQEGNFSFWINPQTDWILLIIEAFIGRLNQQKQRCPKEETRRAALDLADRLLHLACASDWPFMIRAGTNDELAREQMGQIFQRLEYFVQAVENDQIEPALLAELEAECPAFAETMNAPYGRIGSIL
jgi:Uncharacterized conserved protein